MKKLRTARLLNSVGQISERVILADFHTHNYAHLH